MPFLAIVYARDADELRHFRDAHEETWGDTGQLVGVYRLPSSKESTCSGSCSRGRTAGWTRHKDGHMMHSCGRRHPDTRKRIHVTLMDMFGINLLRRKNTPKLFQNPEGYGK
jgi:hypothetical protein